MTTARRRWLVRGVVAFCALAAVWAKVRIESGIALERAVALEAENDLELAISVYRQSIRWYSPFSSPVGAAVVRLREVAVAREAEGDTELALMAWRALRSGLYGVRSLYQPYSEELGPSEDAIARLMATQQAPADLAEQQKLTAHHRELLGRDLAPNPWWSLLAVTAFLAWAVGLFTLAMRGFDDETGAPIRPVALRLVAVCVVTLALWMAGLAKA